MRLRLRLLLPLAALAAATAGAWWFAIERPLAVAAVSRNVPVTVFGLGAVEARVLSRIGFEVPGTLAEVLADHGDRVAAGTVLARLNPASQQARLSRAKASLLSAEASVARAALAEARANHQAERTALAKHALLAPFDALVVARTREPGTALSAAVLVVTHDEKIFDRFDRLVSLRDGRIEAGALSPPGQPSR
jgi:HlyD family secretion protein